MKLTITTTPANFEALAKATGKTDTGTIYNLYAFNRSAEAKSFLANAKVGDTVEVMGNLETYQGAERFIVEMISPWLSPQEQNRLAIKEAQAKAAGAGGLNKYAHSVKFGDKQIWITTPEADVERWENETGVRMAGVTHIPVGTDGKGIENYARNGDMFYGKVQLSADGSVKGFSFNNKAEYHINDKSRITNIYVFKCETDPKAMQLHAAHKVGAK